MTYADSETLYIITFVLSCALLLLALWVSLLMWHVKKLNQRVNFMTPENGEHAFRAPVIQPDEVLAKRGYAQYGGSVGSGVDDYSTIGNHNRAPVYAATKY